MERKHVYRKGDYVRVVKPEWVLRVGYNLVWTDLEEEVGEDVRTSEALEVLGFKVKTIPREFIRAVAMMRVKQRKFGGNERKIFTEAGYFDTTERIYQIVDKRVVKTGLYYPPYGGSYDYDPENGGLSDMKTHIILKLDNYYEIEACHVEPAKEK